MILTWICGSLNKYLGNKQQLGYQHPGMSIPGFHFPICVILHGKTRYYFTFTLEYKMDPLLTYIFSLYTLHGEEDYIGEPVSQLEHMLQAGELARLSGADDEVILAAFFHDLGHLLAFEGVVEQMQHYGVTDHETIGANLLRSAGFSEQIAALVESHVETKRYLTATRPEYYDRLSEASRATLEQQGGRMTAEEVAVFERDPRRDLKIRIRFWDDEAKRPEPCGQTLDYFHRLAVKHIEEQHNIHK